MPNEDMLGQMLQAEGSSEPSEVMEEDVSVDLEMALADFENPELSVADRVSALKLLLELA